MISNKSNINNLALFVVGTLSEIAIAVKRHIVKLDVYVTLSLEAKDKFA
ncbi:hypothetical protein [Halotia branconii]|uniref:Uncharacterized protein n=1 Tax=Halotia branconii CENA392 TaxID=1539056 RepID=A0AAJ6NYA8_9CYAN|nr:hypothetical protein [Halotia branconii]WGV28984.1 hypothetical protein QI031_27165 [Halotia branconii CENA392]